MGERITLYTCEGGRELCEKHSKPFWGWDTNARGISDFKFTVERKDVWIERHPESLEGEEHTDYHIINTKSVKWAGRVTE